MSQQQKSPSRNRPDEENLRAIRHRFRSCSVASASDQVALPGFGDGSRDSGGRFGDEVHDSFDQFQSLLPCENFARNLYSFTRILRQTARVAGLTLDLLIGFLPPLPLKTATEVLAFLLFNRLKGERVDLVRIIPSSAN